jgi:hypothetical protein
VSVSIHLVALAVGRFALSLAFALGGATAWIVALQLTG